MKECRSCQNWNITLPQHDIGECLWFKRPLVYIYNEHSHALPETLLVTTQATDVCVHYLERE